MSRGGNKAQRELERLQDQQQRQIQAGQQVQKLDASKNPFLGSMKNLDRDQDGEANFGTPEAVATAVGASFLLGPVGGVLLGVAQGILGKEMRQNALDAWNSEQDTLSDAAGIFADHMDTLKMAATNDEDLDQLNSYQAQADAGIRMMQSGIPELEATGSQLYQEAFRSVNAYSLTQETQRIAAETEQARQRRELNNEQFDRYSSLQDDYDAQSANFVESQKQMNIAKELIVRGNPVDIVAALISVNKALDPTSVVRPEEAKALGNVGTLIEQAKNKMQEWAETGQAIGPTQRKELMQLVESIEKTTRGFQMKRDIEFQTRAVDAELPTKYLKHFRKVNDLPAFKPGPLQNTQEPGKKTTETVRDVTGIETASNYLTNAMEAAANAGGALKNYFTRDEEERKKARQGVRELPTN